MNPADIATVVLAALGVLGVLVAAIAWFFRRGADEREFAVALKDCARAVRELAAEFRGFRDDVVGELHRHDIRLTKLEAKENDRTPADRDAGTPG